MTQDEIIEITRQAGLHLATDVNWMPIIGLEYAEKLINLATSKEREACAKLVEESGLPDTYSQECLPDIANDIRARGGDADTM